MTYGIKCYFCVVKWIVLITHKDGNCYAFAKASSQQPNYSISTKITNYH
ncbi:hypothetical protein JCM19298_1992 [Nonlabens ulvanivorans]|nr:hypothetical protein JCM19298_1992 [Nonlabens ulvanivorans]